MKAHERRASNAYPFFKLNYWDGRIGCWGRAPKRFGGSFATEREARAAVASTTGRWKIVRIDDRGQVTELEPFETAGSDAS